MFCCAGLASICRSPFIGFDAAPRAYTGRAIGGSSLPIGSYNTALSRAFQLPAQLIFCDAALAIAGSTAHSRTPKNRPGLFSRATHLQSSLPDQSFRIGA